MMQISGKIRVLRPCTILLFLLSDFISELWGKDSCLSLEENLLEENYPVKNYSAGISDRGVDSIAVP
jgi:hypothetical protein